MAPGPTVRITSCKDLPQLEVRGDLTTSGGVGASLLRGVQPELATVALSVKLGGRIGKATVGGRIATSGDHLTTVEIDGEVASLTVTGGIHAEGRTRSGSAPVTSTCPPSRSPPPTVSRSSNASRGDRASFRSAGGA